MILIEMTMQIFTNTKFIILMLLLASCNTTTQWDFKQEIITQYVKHNKKVIDIAKLTPFKWDKFLVFSEGASLLYVEKFTKPDLDLEEFTTKIFFLKDGEIVYQQELPYHPSATKPDDLYFKFIDDTNFHMELTKNIASLEIEKIFTGQTHYYLLKPIK